MASNVAKFIGLMASVPPWRNFSLQILLTFSVGWKASQNTDFDLSAQRLPMVRHAPSIPLYFPTPQQAVVTGSVNPNFNGSATMPLTMSKALA